MYVSLIRLQQSDRRKRYFSRIFIHMVQSSHTLTRQTTNAAPFSCCHMQAVHAGIPIYSGVGFSLLESAILVISAGNGVGKTTLLKQLGGFMPAGHNEVQWFGTSISNPASYEGDMLYIGDKNALYAELTVREQLHYIASQYGQPERLEPSFHYMQLDAYLDMPMNQLSAGWRRRVALCRLLLVPALLWLLDEPMVHLDTQGAKLLSGLLHSHAERGGITILTMPHMDASPSLYNLPVSVLHLEHFTADLTETLDA